MKSILTTIVFLALAVSGLAQTRSVIVNTSGVVQSPTNFWSADVTNARSGLGLGTAATNPATAFQPSSSVLTNLASSNGSTLTNLTAANITGTVGLASNVTGTIAISNGGSGATTAGGARTNLGLGTTNSVAFGNLDASFVNFENVEIGPDLKLEEDGDVLWGTFVRFNVDTMEFSKAISFNTTTNAAITRTNLGLGLSALTNTNTTDFRTAIGLGTTNKVSFDTVSAKQSTGFSSTTLNGIQWQSMYPSSNGLIGLYGSDAEGTTTFGINIGTMSGTTVEVALFNSDRITFYEPLTFNNTTNAATTRTNLSLGWSALTNTNPAGFNTSLYGSGTNPVLYNTNGEVVSPTNFWQVAPIVTRFVESQPTTNQTTNITAARNLHIHSLAISTTGVTNTIGLPTNNSFNGDIALVVHQGPTSSVTAVRTAGAATNLVTLNQFEEAVEFVYYNNVWQFNNNQSFIEPIYFSGTNAATNAAASRTNLGIPLAALTNTNNINFQAAIFNTNSAPTNSANVNTVNFNTAIHWMEVNVVTNGVTNNFRIPLFK